MPFVISGMDCLRSLSIDKICHREHLNWNIHNTFYDIGSYGICSLFWPEIARSPTETPSASPEHPKQKPSGCESRHRGPLSGDASFQPCCHSPHSCNSPHRGFGGWNIHSTSLGIWIFCSCTLSPGFYGSCLTFPDARHCFQPLDDLEGDDYLQFRF